MKTLKTLSLILLLTALNTHALVEESDPSAVAQEKVEISEALYKKGLNIIASASAGVDTGNTLEQLVLQYLAFAAHLGHPTAQDAADVLISSYSYSPGLRDVLQWKNQYINETTLASVQAVTNSSTVEMEVAESLYNKGLDLFAQSLDHEINLIRFGGGISYITTQIAYHAARFFAGVKLLSAAAQLGHPTAQDTADSLLDSWVEPIKNI